eukprot:g20265.t1
MKATSAGNSTTLARILQLVEDGAGPRIRDQSQDAQTRRPTVQRSVDWLASYFTPMVLATAVFTLSFWLSQAEDLDGVTFAITRCRVHVQRVHVFQRGGGSPRKSMET